jgi:hypothetical protein
MQFHDAPPVSKVVGKQPSEHWIKVVSELKDQQQMWAMVGNYALGVATRIKQGKYKSFLPADLPSGQNPQVYMDMHYEVITRRTGPGRTDVWIRWIG